MAALLPSGSSQAAPPCMRFAYLKTGCGSGPLSPRTSEALVGCACDIVLLLASGLGLGAESRRVSKLLLCRDAGRGQASTPEVLWRRGGHVLSSKVLCMCRHLLSVRDCGRIGFAYSRGRLRAVLLPRARTASVQCTTCSRDLLPDFGCVRESASSVMGPIGRKLMRGKALGRSAAAAAGSSRPSKGGSSKSKSKKAQKQEVAESDDVAMPDEEPESPAEQEVSEPDHSSDEPHGVGSGLGLSVDSQRAAMAHAEKHGIVINVLCSCCGSTPKDLLGAWGLCVWGGVCSGTRHWRTHSAMPQVNRRLCQEPHTCLVFHA